MPRLPTVDNSLGERPVADVRTPVVAQPGGESLRMAAQTNAQDAAVIGQQTDQLATKLQSVQAGIRTRADAVARAKAIEDYTTLAQQEYLKAETEGDLADVATTDGYGKLLSDKMGEIISSHPGSEQSRLDLQARLDGIRGNYVRQAGMKGAAVGQQRVLSVLNNQFGTLTAQVQSSPGELNSILRAGDALIDDMAPALSPEQETLARASLRKELALSAVNGLANRGKVREARALLADTPGLVEMLGPDQQRTLENQFSATERKDEETRNAGRRKVEEAAQILGRQPTLAERVKLAGLDMPAGPQTAAQKIAELESVLGPLNPDQKRKALGVDTGGGGAQSTAGKIVEDRVRFVNQYGENSPQVRMFDEATASEGGPKMSDVASMRKEYTGLSAPFVASRDGFGRIAAADPTPAGDIALVFGYMKMLDPGSTVREGEYATAQNAASVPDRVRQQYNKALTGEGLLPEQRTDFRTQAENVFRSALRNQAQIEAQYRSLATRAGFSPEDVAVDLIGAYRPYASGQPDAAPTPGGGKPAQPDAAASATPTPLDAAGPKRFKYDLEGNLIGGDMMPKQEPAKPKAEPKPKNQRGQ